MHSKPTPKFLDINLMQKKKKKKKKKKKVVKISLLCGEPLLAETIRSVKQGL